MENEFVKKYHEVCKKIDASKLSDISLIETVIGTQIGFVFGENLVFWDDESICMATHPKDAKSDDDLHEIGIYELSDLK